MAQDTTLGHGAPGIASFATQSYGGPVEPRYGEGVPTTTDLIVKAGADLLLPIYSVVSVIGGILALAVRGGSTGFATGTVTFSTAVPAADDNVSVGGVTYTFKAAPTPPATLDPGQVAIGGTLAATATNLAAAVNGTDGVNAPNPLVTASANSAVVTFTAIEPGDEGNAITLAKTAATGANVTVSGATLSGGDDDPDVRPYGITTHPVSLLNGQSMSVSFYREGHWDMDALNWHASYATDHSKKTAFEGSLSPNIFISKKKFNNNQIAV